MAGSGARFGYKFKPFLQVEGKGKFIELAFEPFNKWERNIKDIIFIYLEEQEQEHNVTDELSNIFPNINFKSCILKQRTSGPAETIKFALNKMRISGPVILCDCDHTLNVDEIFEKVFSDQFDCILPVWTLRDENIKSWSVVSITESGMVTGIAEKELPSTPGEFFGVIGCYYLKDSNLIKQKSYNNISECIYDLINDGKHVTAIKINEANFFGDPLRLEKTLKGKSKNLGTIFCDLDGTIIVHEDSPSNLGIKILNGAHEKLQEIKAKGYHIILTTARNPVNDKYLRSELARHNIPYDQLIMGLPSGPRILINDRKPSDFLKPSASAIEVERNTGIGAIDISIPEVKIIERLKGGSFADTLLLEREGKKYVRKVASKRANLDLGYVKLKKQFRQLSRFSSFKRSIVPKLILEEENSFEYFFDMEYLNGYSLLSDCKFNLQYKAIENLLANLSEHIYIQTALLQDGSSWLKQHLENKVFNKLNPEQYSGQLEQLLRHEMISINGETYKNIHNLIEQTLDKHESIIAPKYLCPIHGDLTFENILCQEEFGLDVKLIDMDGAEYLDAIELDMGKMFQSIITNYEEWSRITTPLIVNTSAGIVTNYSFDFESDHIDKYINLWSSINGESYDIIKVKAYFYLALHLIRMIRFRLKVSEDQAIFALVNSILLLSKLLKY
tara:strand:+ start:590 stop:2611 length:2022 start_codon:yes stop_codon:yes gene_type:complete